MQSGLIGTVAQYEQFQYCQTLSADGTCKSYKQRIIYSGLKMSRNMEASDMTDRELDYQRTIARARCHTCSLLFLHAAMGICALIILIIDGSIYAAAPMTLDILADFVDVWQLNTFHFFRSGLFKPLIIITSILTILQIGTHIGLYFLMMGDDPKIEITILLFAGIGIGLLALAISLAKNRFVLQRMVQGKEDLNRIKHSLISQEHFQYALKKSLQTGS